MSVSVPANLPATLPQVVLKSRRAQPFFGRHPWVFSGAIARVASEPAPGAEVALVTDRGEFVARGLFNPLSNIQVRLYSWDADRPLDEEFWSARLDSAIRLRRDVLGLCGPDTASRIVFSEADALSGLIVDRYGDWLLVQFTSLALAARRDLLVRLLVEKLKPAGVWLRTEKGIREAEGLEIADGLLTGQEPPRPLFISEHGLRYGLDVVEGQKTGFFLDQRDNRHAFVRYVRGGRVLDLCCYSGGFAMNALRHGNAREVLAIDVSEPALALARANVEANGLAANIRFEKSDAFKALEKLRDAGERFDLIVLDPPKLARHSRGVAEALRGYHSLNRMALEVLEADGTLVTCSCTGHVSREMFAGMLAEAAASAKRPLQILEARGPSPDHPTSVHCIETNYLKCYICRAG
ncbi:MAG TPA: class I SAM-dependent rRNA methyltransferase [Planctomycetaceae bacterium]|nr:class I SAM-dependent rRNA methyltransferase [Planctomycetaceae bacterium]